MSAGSFLAWADLLPEPTLLVHRGGRIEAANRAFLREQGLGAHSVAGAALEDLAVDSAQKIGEYLRACLRSGQLLIGALTLRGRDGAPCAYRVQGVGYRPDGELRAELVLLRLAPRGASAMPFTTLGEKIAQLNAEIERRKLIEEKLRDERETLQVTLASIGDAVMVTDATGRITYLNHIAERLTGWLLREARGRELPEIFRIVNESSREPVENPVEKVFASGRVIGLANHTVLLARDGREVPIDDSAAPIVSESRGVLGAVLIFRDVTERRATETALRESEARFRYSFQAVAVSLWEEDFTEVARLLDSLRASGVEDLRAHLDRHPELVAEAARRVVIRDVNRHSLDLFGARSKEELMGSLETIFTEDSYAVFKEELIALAEGRQSVTGDVEVRTLAGEPRQCLLTVTFPPRGEPLNRVLVSLLDITERRRAEQALELQSHVLESMSEGVSVSDEAGVIVYTNPAEDRMFGYARGELLGQRVTVQNAYPPAENERRVAEVIGQLRREGAWAGEWHNRRKDGSTFFTESYISVLRRGEKPLWICVQRDITDRKRQEAQRELLVGELAHRVKNTLAIVQSLASQTLRRSESLQDFHERFSGRLDALARTHDLLMREGWEHVGLGELIMQTVKLTLPERVRLEGPPIELSPNVAVSLSMLLHELYVNAVKYGALGAKGGGVEVSWRVAPEDASVELTWAERGGPPVHSSGHEGFGTRLLQSIERELSARISREFAREGLRCRMSLPLGASVRLVPAGGSAPAHPPA